MIDDAKLLDDIIEEFTALTRIPRPSGHEHAVSDYLKKRFEEIGCTVVQDAHWNIIADLPASEGCEAAPLTVLQGHMDMVCVGAQSPAWRENPESALARIMGEVYAAHNGGAQMTIESIHAGLETSWHAAKNPALDMVSIGVTAHDIHTPNERIEIAAIVPEAHLMMETLRRIAAEA